jgi:hypothetical protein
MSLQEKRIRRLIHVATPCSVALLPIFLWVFVTFPLWDYVWDDGPWNLDTYVLNGVFFAILALIALCVVASTVLLVRDLRSAKREGTISLDDLFLDGYPLLGFLLALSLFL